MGMQSYGELAYGVWVEGDTVEDNEDDQFLDRVEADGSPLTLVGLGDFSTSYVNYIVALANTSLSGDAWDPKSISPVALSALASPEKKAEAEKWCRDHLPEVDFTKARWLLAACYA